MPSILDRIVEQKKLEIIAAKNRVPVEIVRDAAENSEDQRDFLGALMGSEIGLIAEVKKASPSKGLIREDFDPPSIAQAYEKGGASCISVLTDEHFFQGHLDFLKLVRQSVSLPILRKDFILDPYQIFEARSAGADAVLLIAECLEPSQLKDLHDQIVSLGMTPLVELYDKANLDSVLACEPKLVGVNNRDLNTFEVDLDHSIRLRKEIPSDILMVGESGIFHRSDVLKLQASGIGAILVGESLMRADDILLATQQLLGTD